MSLRRWRRLTRPPKTERLASTGIKTGIQQMPTDTATSMKDVTNTVAADEAATEVNAAEPSASDSTSEPTKPAGRPATPRPVVRDSLKVGEQLRDVPHRGDGGRTITRTAAAGDEAAAKSSSAASSPTALSSPGSNSSGGDSSGGDAGGS